jgi:metallo-beta-lactamase class B
MQVLPGIYQVNGSPYGHTQNNYLIQCDGATVLIDSGDLTVPTLPDIEKNMARWGVKMEDVSHLFITHAHFDHASHAAELQRRGIKIVASPQTAEAIASGDERCIGYAVQRTFEPCQVDILLNDQEELKVANLSIRAIAAPGHANGFLIYELLLKGERLWFTSDLFEAVNAHTDIILPWTGSPDFDKSIYIQSLKRLLTLPPCDHLFPGHGPVAIGNAGRLIQMAYREALAKWR